jgi:hypothetical protein
MRFCEVEEVGQSNNERDQRDLTQLSTEWETVSCITLEN